MFRYSGRSALCAIGATRAREEGRLLFSPLFLATDMVAHTTDIGDLGIVADETSLIYIRCSHLMAKAWYQVSKCDSITLEKHHGGDALLFRPSGTQR
jgi:hypothetical protein